MRLISRAFRVIVLPVLAVISFQNSNAQTAATDYFRTKNDGLWSNKLIWESSHDSILWENATLFPDDRSSGITICNGDSVNIGASVFVDQVKVLSGGILSNTFTFNLSNGPGIDLDVFGKLDVKQYIATSAQIVIREGAVYNKYLNSNTQVNRCTWEANSTLNLISYSTTNIINLSALDQHFFNLTIDGRTQNSILNLKFDQGTQIDGDFTILSSNYKEVRLSSTTSDLNINVFGNFNISNSIVAFNAGGDLLTTFSLLVHGNVALQNPSQLNINSSSNELVLYGNLYLPNGCQINKSPNKDGLLKFAGNQVQNVNLQGSINRTNILLNSNSSVTFNALTPVISPYTLTLENGSSLILPTPNISAIIKKYINPGDWSSSMEGWHLLSSPVQNQSIESGGFTEAPYDFYSWNESGNIWMNQKITGNNITAFAPGKGYLASYQNGGTKIFTGNLNTSSITFNNLTCSPYANSGFHLLGNPFPCSLDWNASGWNLNGFSQVAQIWNDNAGNYIPLTDDYGVIPPEQGFFVQATSSTNSLTIPTQARIHSNAPFNKQIPVNVLRIRITDPQSAKFDETVIKLSENGSSGFDEFDAIKIQGSENAPELYTKLTTGEKTCVISYPSNSYPRSVNLYFKPGNGEAYLLQAITNTFETDVWLEDKFTDTFLLLKDSTISIDATAPFSDDRFVLHLGSLGIPESKCDNDRIYAFQDNLYFQNIPGPIEYEVYSLTGNLLTKGRTQNQKVTLSESRITPGVYIVRLNTQSELICKKIVIL